MPKACVEGVHLSYQQIGQGPDVVMIHGLAVNLAFWYAPVASLLAREYRITVYDLRGHGNSDMPVSGYDSFNMACDLRGLLDYLDLRRVHLVGHSFGGTVALQLAALAPDRIAGLVVADSRIRAVQRAQRLVDWPGAEAWWRSEDRLGELEADREIDYRLLEILARRSAALPPQATGRRGFRPFATGRGSQKTARRWLQLLSTTRARREFEILAGLTRKRLRQIRQPACALYGEHSFCLPSCSWLRDNLPRCRAVIIPQAGHFHPIVQPRLFADALRDFLRSAPEKPVSGSAV